MPRVEKKPPTESVIAKQAELIDEFNDSLIDNKGFNYLLCKIAELEVKIDELLKDK